MICRLVFGWLCLGLVVPAKADDRVAMQAMISRHAKANGVPESLVHRIVQRESGYNASATSPGHFGLMQIRYDTARSMGFAGRPDELLDANTNLTFAVPYLANAYTVAGGDPDRAVRLYSSGYYYDAKRKGLLGQLRTARSAPVRDGRLEDDVARTGSLLPSAVER
jgi:soluble lytic murein transglycosylase-like protein